MVVPLVLCDFPPVENGRGVILKSDPALAIHIHCLEQVRPLILAHRVALELKSIQQPNRLHLLHIPEVHLVPLGLHLLHLRACNLLGDSVERNLLQLAVRSEQLQPLHNGRFAGVHGRLAAVVGRGHVAAAIVFHTLPDPRVLESFVGSNSFRWILVEQLAAQVLGVFADVGPRILGEVDRILENPPEHDLVRVLPVVLPVEGRLSGKQHIKHHAAAPNIRLQRVRLPNDFGGNVVRGSGNFGELRGLLAVVGQSEVRHLQRRTHQLIAE
mmetsp:Transcript_15771/g.40158  ORF Transcript_15771/g.40158 Transcript_15771/m.40158 type:complete len:270 (+) Transcript_15771:602-1411(+)